MGKLRLSPALGVFVIIFGSALLGLELWPQKPLVPYATVLALAMQIGIFVVAMPLLRIRLTALSLTVVVLWLLFFIWSLLSGFWSAYPLHSFKRSLVVFVPSLLLLLLVYGDGRPIETFWKVLFGLTYLGGGLAFGGLLLYFMGSSIYLDQWQALNVISLGPIQVAQLNHLMGSWQRISSFVSNPNVLATWLMITLLATMALYISGRLRLATASVLGGVQVLALFFTFSRTAIGALALALLLYAFLQKRKTGFKFISGVLVVLLLTTGLLMLLNLYFTNPDENALVRSNTLLSNRELAWMITWDTYIKQPIMGVGFGSTYDALLKDRGVNILHPHNIFLSVLAETGMVGFLFFFGLWGLGLGVGLYRKNKALTLEQNPAAIHFTITCVLLTAFLIHHIFEVMVLRVSVYTLIWVYFIAFATHPLMVPEKR